MYVTPEQIAAGNKAGVEAIIGLANSQFAFFERWSALNLNLTKAAFEDSVNYAKSLLGAKDADGNVIVLGPRSEVAIGEPIF